MKIRFEHISLGYGDRVLIEDCSFSIEPGKLVLIVGANGSGKSTLLKALLGRKSPKKGNIFLGKQKIKEISNQVLAKKISTVLTQPVHIPMFPVKEVLALGRYPYTGFTGKLKEKDEQKINALAELLHLKPFLTKKIDTLSDGERQKVMIARAMLQETPLMMLDEPTSFLDIKNRRQIFQILRDAADKGKGILMITHQIPEALAYADAVLFLNGDGKWKWFEKKEDWEKSIIDHLME